MTDHFIRVASLIAAGVVLGYTKTVDRTSEKSVSACLSFKSKFLFLDNI
jgi:uncharacterized protein YfiM (DUF2279 family)